MKKPIGRKVRKYYRWTPPDKEWLEYQYGLLGKSCKTIGVEVGCDKATVKWWLINAGIPLVEGIELLERKMATQYINHPYSIDTGTQRKHFEALGPPQKCVWCGTKENIQMHHKNHIKKDGRFKNLVWLCGDCHRIETAIWNARKHGKISITIENNTILLDYNIGK